MYLEECCTICKFSAESGVHNFRDCALAAQVWELLPFGKLVLGPCLGDPLSWIKYVANVPIGVVLCFVYGIYGHKGLPSFVMKELGQPKTLFCLFIGTWRSSRQSTSTCPAHTQSMLWKPPPIGSLKINCDASLDLHTATTGVGHVVNSHS